VDVKAPGARPLLRQIDSALASRRSISARIVVILLRPADRLNGGESSGMACDPRASAKALAREPLYEDGR